jgi:hypothetical protein
MASRTQAEADSVGRALSPSAEGDSSVVAPPLASRTTAGNASKSELIATLERHAPKNAACLLPREAPAPAPAVVVGGHATKEAKRKAIPITAAHRFSSGCEVAFAPAANKRSSGNNVLAVPREDPDATAAQPLKRSLMTSPLMSAMPQDSMALSEGGDAASTSVGLADLSVEDLVREVLMMRRKVRLGRSERKWDDEYEIGDMEGGQGELDEEVGTPDLPEIGRLEGQRHYAHPGAFRVGGARINEDDDDTDNLSSDESALLPSTSLRGPAPIAGRRSDTILLEADLVEEQEGGPSLLVEATPIRRRRQRLAVAALVLVACTVVALAVGVPLGLKRSGPDPAPPPLAPDYALANVSSLQNKFTKDALPNSTREAVSRGDTPQAKAYGWLFTASGDHPPLPAEDVLARLAHRFSLATLYFSTGGGRKLEDRERLAR